MNDTLSLKMGFANLGNTCFLNVVLQALRLNPSIGNIFLKEIHPREKSKKLELVHAFQTLMRDIWKETPKRASVTMAPRGFYISMLNVLRDTDDSWYSPGHQCCAAETIQYILDSLHDGLHKRVKMDIYGSPNSSEEASHIRAMKSWSSFFAKEYSPIVDSFYGQTQKSIQCETCKHVSETYEPWIVKELPIPGAEVVGGPVPDLLQCLTSAFATETLDDYQCDTCAGRRKAIKMERISRLPPVVILHLKRFTNNQNKVCGKIVWDLDSFNFKSVLAFRRDPFQDCVYSSEYETTAVIEHHGSFRGGHYTMFGKQCGVWNEYDDSSVGEVTPDRVVSNNSYIVFLVRKTQADDLNQSFTDKVKLLRRG